MTAAAFTALPRRPPPDPRQLPRSLLLAVLLHVWLVLVLGNATGTAAPGQGVWGSLTVKVLGRSGGEPGAPPGDAARETRDNGAPGDQAQTRQGGQVRPAPPVPAEPGAAELGRWTPREAERAEAAPPAPSTLQLPEGFRPVERERITAPTPPQPTPLPELPAAVGRLDARPDAAVAPLPAPASLRAESRAPALPTVSTDLPAPVRRLDDPATETAPRPQRAADLRPAPTPAVAAPGADLPPPVRRLESTTAPPPTPALMPPAELRGTAPATPVSPAPATALPAPVQRLEAPSTADGGGVTPLTRDDSLRTPAAAATAPSSLAGSQELPAPVRRLEAADSASATVTPLQRVTPSTPSVATPGAAALTDLSSALPGQVAAPAGPARGDPAASRDSTAPRSLAGSPDAGSRLGPDLAVPPSASASAPRAPLNLSLPRSGDMASRRGPGLVELVPPPPERKSKLEQSIENAANPDCRKAYANAGLLAAVPLALDAARGKGCKW